MTALQTFLAAALRYAMERTTDPDAIARYLGNWVAMLHDNGRLDEDPDTWLDEYLHMVETHHYRDQLDLRPHLPIAIPRDTEFIEQIQTHDTFIALGAPFITPGALAEGDAVKIVTTDQETWDGYVTHVRKDGTAEVMFF